MRMLSILTIIFVVFKFFGKTDWNWFLVFLPFIIETVLLVIMKIIEESTQ